MSVCDHRVPFGAILARARGDRLFYALAGGYLSIIPALPAPTHINDIAKKIATGNNIYKTFLWVLKAIKTIFRLTFILLYTLLLNPAPKKECCLKIWKNERDKINCMWKSATIKEGRLSGATPLCDCTAMCLWQSVGHCNGYVASR